MLESDERPGKKEKSKKQKRSGKKKRRDEEEDDDDDQNEETEEEEAQKMERKRHLPPPEPSTDVRKYDSPQLKNNSSQIALLTRSGHCRKIHKVMHRLIVISF